MSTKDSFEMMKEQGLRDFESTYGAEARELYGDDAIDASNARMMDLTKDEWDAKELLEEAIKVQLRLAMATGNPEGEEARELAHMHERWISIHWGVGYEPEAYLGLVDGYLKDPRFVKYYDSAAGEGATELLVQAVHAAHA
ncbi:MAG: TipAS antibiotic-recognition domain-containing protein [Coriobacteriales bacterium]